eukprot:CAMPEP_0201562060 /NCGR_PEP_ID=MMETSP0173_2-20130828/79126_1 /ASSEMBLY_ACC=CAM_ASM_000268 /TAXON_ID=218659 /ORGANISM="Vexillifera sp., Strain DIVA3 564/2" /LENGTH=168 /DNA_ID=CAMNT_0047976597 /DNA_START=258 /DNA_END=760 /DNA_ORIENTATION=+
MTTPTTRSIPPHQSIALVRGNPAMTTPTTRNIPPHQSIALVRGNPATTTTTGNIADVVGPFKKQISKLVGGLLNNTIYYCDYCYNNRRTNDTRSGEMKTFRSAKAHAERCKFHGWQSYKHVRVLEQLSPCLLKLILINSSECAKPEHKKILQKVEPLVRDFVPKLLEA